jgi:hypothetical protein
MGWVASVTPRLRFTPVERTPTTHCIGGLVGPRAGLDAGARRKICPCRGSNLDRSIVQPVVRHYTAWATEDNSKEFVQIGTVNVQDFCGRIDVQCTENSHLYKMSILYYQSLSRILKLSIIRAQILTFRHNEREVSHHLKHCIFYR